MNEPARTILGEFQPDPEPRDLHAVAELDHPLWVQTGLATFRQWLGVPGASNTRRPSIELLEVLFGRGRLALSRLFRAFEATITPAESVVVLRALGAVCRAAQARKVIDWNVDGLKPDDGRGRLLVSFDSDLDTKLRSAAAAEKQSMSDFVRMAVAARVDAVLFKRRPRSTVPA